MVKFKNFDYLTDGEIDLNIEEKVPYNEVKDYVPTYKYRIIKDVAIAHGMKKLIITCNPDNYPSRKTCEKIGLKLKEIVDLPTYNEMYISGERQKCIYEWYLD